MTFNHFSYIYITYDTLLITTRGHILSHVHKFRGLHHVQQVSDPVCFSLVTVFASYSCDQVEYGVILRILPIISFQTLHMYNYVISAMSGPDPNRTN